MIKKSKFPLLDVVRIPLTFAPVLTVLFVAQEIIVGLLPTFTVLATANFIDTALSIANGSSYQTIFTALSYVIILLAINWIMQSSGEILFSSFMFKMRLQVRTAILDKRSKLMYRFVEDTESWDLISRISDFPEQKMVFGFNDSLKILSLSIRIAGLLTLIVTQVWWAAIVILVFGIPLIWAAIKGGREVYQGNRETTKLKRQYEYLSSILYNRDGVEERTLFGYGEKMDGQFYSFYETVRKKLLKINLKSDFRSSMAGIIVSVVTIAIALVLLGPVIAGAVTIGFFMAMINAVFSLGNLFVERLDRLASAITENLEFLKDLANFFSLEEEMDNTTDSRVEETPVFQSLSFNNVRFKYPGSENYILDGISFTINAGQHYAFVGINGAGKTTITKLITGLYNNYEGEILINGKSLKTFTLSELRSYFAVVYQDFARYGIPLSENITVGRNGLDIKKAVEQSELQNLVETLPNGLDTPLGKILPDGVDISGGEWQRVAMARAVISKAPVRILDEPTAALDPINESKIYEQYESISHGKTTLFISHRLGSTRLANHIFVIGEGRVQEEGSHNQLMEMNGLYAKMYESQKGWYK